MSYKHFSPPPAVDTPVGGPVVTQIISQNLITNNAEGDEKEKVSESTWEDPQCHICQERLQLSNSQKKSSLARKS